MSFRRNTRRGRYNRGAILLFVALSVLTVSVGATPLLAADAPMIALPSFTELAKRYGPAVVNISTSQTVKAGEGYHQFKHPYGEQQPNDLFDLFDPFLRRQPQRDYTRRSLGSGFIISEDGYILTNNHVVAEADEITVLLQDEEEYKAEITGRDPRTDIALIKIDADNLPVVVLGDSSSLEVGEWVLAIGNPLALGHTVTAGIVSAMGRNHLGLAQYEDFIQTDASINPGNSGGPLFNLRGEVVGINTAIASTTGGSIGIGFAVPVNMVKKIVPQLKEKGKVVRGWLGVIIQDVDKEKMEVFDLKSRSGALVSQVVEDGPAEDAGLEVGDVIIAFEGQAVEDFDDLPPLVAGTPVGTKAKVKVIRKGKEKIFNVRLGELPDESELTESPVEEGESLGIRVRTITPEIAGRLGIGEEMTGVVVTEVEATSPAEKANLRPGDIIIEVNRRAVKDAGDFGEAIRKATDGKVILFLVRRGRNTIFITLKKPN